MHSLAKHQRGVCSPSRYQAPLGNAPSEALLPLPQLDGTQETRRRSTSATKQLLSVSAEAQAASGITESNADVVGQAFLEINTSIAALVLNEPGRSVGFCSPCREAVVQCRRTSLLTRQSVQTSNNSTSRETRSTKLTVLEIGDYVAITLCVMS
jgi:hypothetical protein